jgi:hypothetical protein
MIRGPGCLPLLALAAAAACNRPEGGLAGQPPLVELRDARGQRQLAIWKTEEGFRWLDAREGGGGILAGPGGQLRAQDPQRGPVELSVRAPGTVQIARADGTALRLSREGDLLRLGDAAGIPLARARIDQDEALVHDAGGVVTMRVRRAGGRIVVMDRGGGALAFVVGQTTLEHAALAALSSLSAVERALLLVMRGP